MEAKPGPVLTLIPCRPLTGHFRLHGAQVQPQEPMTGMTGTGDERKKIVQSSNPFPWLLGSIVV